MEKQKNPLISIIIPVYNGSNYISQSIESALNQTYENKEIIVVDDGSVDNTEEICKKYGNKIRYYKKENGGVSTALNLALEKMKGEYFSWLSHDDLYTPDKIEEEVKVIEKDTIILSDYNLIDQKNKIISNIILPHEVIEKHNEFALFKGFINGITLLIPKKAFEECENFNEEMRCVQDYDMWLRMLLKHYKFKHISKVLASSRQHSRQTTNTSPRVIEEGNELWINMMESLPNKTKIEINSNIYNFYRDMSQFLKKTPYKEAYKYAEKRMLEEKENIKINLKETKVSVIMPFYDESKEILVRAINSVLNQTHKNLELVIINDNPNNYSKKIIDGITKDVRVRYIENKTNLGVSASRNEGVKQSTGEYIAFLDADDEFLENKIKEQLEMLVLTDQNFSHTSYIKSEKKEEVINSGLLDGEVYRECIYDCRIATPTVMIKKSFWDENKLAFNEAIHIGEDTCLWLDILTKVPVIGIDTALTKVHVDNQSAAYNSDKQIIGLKNILTYVLNNEILSKYDKEIALLSRNYFNIVLTEKNDGDIEYKYNQIINNPMWKATKPFRLLYKTIISIKNEGIGITIHKIKRFLCKK